MIRLNYRNVRKPSCQYKAIYAISPTSLHNSGSRLGTAFSVKLCVFVAFWTLRFYRHTPKGTPTAPSLHFRVTCVEHLVFQAVACLFSSADAPTYPAGIFRSAFDSIIERVLVAPMLSCLRSVRSVLGCPFLDAAAYDASACRSSSRRVQRNWVQSWAPQALSWLSLQQLIE